MRGGKREGAGRKRKDRLQKSVMIEKKYMKYLDRLEARSFSDKINDIFEEYFDFLM